MLKVIDLKYIVNKNDIFGFKFYFFYVYCIYNCIRSYKMNIDLKLKYFIF